VLVDHLPAVVAPLEDAGAAGLCLGTVRADVVESPGHGEVAVHTDGEVGDVEVDAPGCDSRPRRHTSRTSSMPTYCNGSTCSYDTMSGAMCSISPSRSLAAVLGFTAAEVAVQLDTSTAAVNSALQRARTVIDSTAPTQQTVLRELGDQAIGAIVTRWTDAWQAGDIDAIVTMLTDDARYSMPPLPEWYHGVDEIRAFLLRGPLQSHWRFLPTTANGQLAFGTYLWDDTAEQYLPGGLDVLTIRSGRVAEVTAFLTADLTRFGLLPSLSR
jgi:ketosteroid isomerase-like protein